MVLRSAERIKVNVSKMKCLRNLPEVSQIPSVSHEGCTEELELDQRVLICF